MAFFKGDETEIKMYSAGLSILENITLALNQFYNGIYGSVPMGELIYDEKRVPLTNAIRREIFIDTFREIFEAWQFCGTFESYIIVLKKIFGEDSTVEFTVPARGQLQIAVTATGISSSFFIAREIVDNEYVIDNVVDQDGDHILFSSLQGIETQSELEKILFFMVPSGIYTEVSLTIGS